MTAAVIEKEPFEVPEGGLASFLTATEGDWSDSAIEGAETDYILELADKLAGYGREGDTALAHVAPGETVVPLEVLDADPELKNRLFAQMRDMGLEPERYVVGSELNSLNPTTGQPEFFLKKVFKGVKKAVKGVVKVFKKFAPVILSVGLSALFPPLGAIASGALGSGIGTLIQGGNLKDAFKAALIGGAVGGISSGITSVAQGGTFMSGVKGGLPGGTFGGGPAPTPAPITDGVPEIVQGAADSAVVPPSVVSDAVAQAAPAGAPATAQQAVAQAIDPSMVASTTKAAVESPLTLAQNIVDPSMVASTSTAMTADPIGIASAFNTAPAPAIAANQSQGMSAVAAAPSTGIEQVAGTTGLATEAAAAAGKPPGFFESLMEGNLKEAFLPSAPSQELLFQRAGELQNSALQKGLKLSGEKALEMATKELSAGALRTYGPLAGLGLGAMYLSGGFDAPEMDELPDAFGGMTGSKLLQMYPQQYGLAQPGSGYTPITAADGGAIENFPRRNGAIYGPGTETSDDVPAMLSDGEFVMTARAVRGAGNGSREQGMRRMYDMMRKFEGGAIRGN